MQKFGGTSIRNKEGNYKSIVHIKKELKLNHKVICVVSAMGRESEPYATDTLKNLIRNYVTKKEQDRLLSIGEIISSVVFTDFLVENGIKAISLSTKEIGIITNNNFTNADIIKINDIDILNKISEYDVIVVPGFQGLTIDGEVSTLGRGGSDTTAITLGIALNALYVEIISDVDGVFTADPRIVPDAVKIPKLNFDVLIDMTQNGSRVLHYKAAKLAKNHNIKMKFVSINDYNSYTEVIDEEVLMTNLSYKTDYIQYKIKNKVDFIKCYEYENNYYVHLEDSILFHNYLNEKNILSEKKEGFSKITIIIYGKIKSFQTYFVETKYVYKKLNELHQKIIKRGENSAWENNNSYGNSI